MSDVFFSGLLSNEIGVVGDVWKVAVGFLTRTKIVGKWRSNMVQPSKYG
jgi:hypothetical protein